MLASNKIMKKYFIYIGSSGGGLLDVKYYEKELSPTPKHLLFVGTATVKDEFFGKRLESHFEKELDDYYQRRKNEEKEEQ